MKILEKYKNNDKRVNEAIELIKLKKKEFHKFQNKNKIILPHWYKSYILANGV